MTPLAHRIAKQLTLPLAQRTFRDDASLLRRLDDIHCFECTEVMDLADTFVMSFGSGASIDERTSFLPAPKTWLEVKVGAGRVGWLLEAADDAETCTVTMAVGNERTGSFAAKRVGNLALGTLRQSDLLEHIDTRVNDEWVGGGAWAMLGFLAIINTPRIIGRRQHMPHRGLERQLTRALGVQGRFPLNAWTEIKLQVAPPKDMSGEGSTEAHLTGQRALHFCRSHLRIRLGRLEVVRSHWRGDASLGIRQSRYRLAA